MDLGHSTAPPPLAHGSRGEEHDSRRQDFQDYMASMDLMGTPVEERVNVFGEFVEIQSRIARDPSTRTPWPIRRLAEYVCGTSAPPQDDSLLYDHDFDDEDTTRRCEEAAYCRAALESHAGIDPPPDPGVAEGGSAPYKGQGSVMFSYRESGKMRFGTLNVKGLIQGVPGVSLYYMYLCTCFVFTDNHVFYCSFVCSGTHSWLMSSGHSRLTTSMCWG